MTENQARRKAQKACDRLFLTDAEKSAAFLHAGSIRFSGSSASILKISGFLNFSDVYSMNPEYFFTDMPYEVAVMSSREEIEEKLAQADVDRVVERLLSACREKGKKLYEFGLRPGWLIRDGRTRYLKMTVRKFFSVTEELAVDPAAILFGEAYRPVPYPVTEAMMDLLNRDAELRRMIYSLMTGRTEREL